MGDTTRQDTTGIAVGSPVDVGGVNRRSVISIS